MYQICVIMNDYLKTTEFYLQNILALLKEKIQKLSDDVKLFFEFYIFVYAFLISYTYYQTPNISQLECFNSY